MKAFPFNQGINTDWMCIESSPLNQVINTHKGDEISPLKKNFPLNKFHQAAIFFLKFQLQFQAF